MYTVYACNIACPTYCVWVLVFCVLVPDLRFHCSGEQQGVIYMLPKREYTLEKLAAKQWVSFLVLCALTQQNS